MPRKKKQATEAAAPENDVTMNSGATTAVAETDARAGDGAQATAALPPVQRPAWIDGPPSGDSDGPDNPQAKNWGDPYKSIFSTPSFERVRSANTMFTRRYHLFIHLLFCEADSGMTCFSVL